MKKKSWQSCELMNYIPTNNEREDLQLFEEQCVETLLHEREERESSTLEEKLNSTNQALSESVKQIEERFTKQNVENTTYQFTSFGIYIHIYIYYFS